MSAPSRVQLERLLDTRRPLDFGKTLFSIHQLVPGTNDLSNRRTLARRLFLQIISLPPTPEQISEFLADEQLDTIGRTVLPQTLGCACCHNHNFDPIPPADYYALASIFTSTDVMYQRYMQGEQRLMERLIGIGELDVASDDAS